MRAYRVLVALCFLAPALAQDSPFIPPETFRLLGAEISGDIAYDHLRHLTLYNSPTAASQGFRDKMRWISEKAKDNGLEEVHFIDLPFLGREWTPKSAELFMISPEYRRLASYEEMAVSIADNSSSGEWEGELIDADTGARDADYEGKDVKGKIVLVSGSPEAAMEQAVRKRGALGVVCYNIEHGIDHPDQALWIHLGKPRSDFNAAYFLVPRGTKSTFAFSISYRAGMELKQRLAAPPAANTQGPGKKIVLHATVSAQFGENPSYWLLEGWIRGRRHDQAIVLTAHAQEKKFSANDNGSGVANLLEISRVLEKLMREGKLPRPERDIRFWWTNEMDSDYQYFAAHPEERAKILFDLNQDAVGAKQSIGSRVQDITRTPYSRPTCLNDVVESIATAVMRGNTSYIPATEASSTELYSKPILSRFGTREHYDAEVVPYFGYTDHQAFNDVIIGIPAITLTNWPDDFFHSNEDDLWGIDPTQLQRNAFITATTALYFAELRPAEVAVLAAQVSAGAHRRLNADFARATEMLSLAPGDRRAAALLDGWNLIEQAVLRESAALESVRVFNAGAPVAPLQKSVVAAAASLRDVLSEHYRLLAGTAQLPVPRLSEEEQAMAKKVPEVALSVGDYDQKRSYEGSPGLTGAMHMETLNFVDGHRSCLDIYRAVRAEAQSAGAWYYGTVEEKQVEDVLNSAVKAGFLKFK